MHSRRLEFLVLLGVVAGASDATAFVRLGEVFASVITGNLVLLGLSAARGDGARLLVAGCALGGYAIGALATAPTADDPSPAEGKAWPATITSRLWIEAGLLILFAVGWELAARPHGFLRFGLLIVLAAAMGTQSVAVRRLGSLSTTYMTGTLTALIEAIRARRWSPERTRDLGILLGVLVGAAAALELVAHARRALPALQLVPLMIVLLWARVASGKPGSPSPCPSNVVSK